MEHSEDAGPPAPQEPGQGQAQGAGAGQGEGGQRPGGGGRRRRRGRRGGRGGGRGPAGAGQPQGQGQPSQPAGQGEGSEPGRSDQAPAEGGSQPRPEGRPAGQGQSGQGGGRRRRRGGRGGGRGGGAPQGGGPQGAAAGQRSGGRPEPRGRGERGGGRDHGGRGRRDRDDGFFRGGREATHRARRREEPPPQRTSHAVGILGGGQLARMLVQAAWGIGVRPLVMADDPRSPAAKVSPGTVIGDFDNEQALRELISRAEKIVFENEFVRKDLLERAAGGKRPFWPMLDVIGQLQDKAGQKEALAKLGIPSAPYECVRTAENLDSWIGHMHETFPAGAVFKWTQRGYDGKGVFVSSGKPEDLAAGADFCRQALERGIAVLAEQKVAFKRELAIIACYSKNREFVAYPVVISEQWEGICSRVYGPARAFGLTEAQENQAKDFAKKLAESLGLTGVFALELFELENGQLWVNEIAPRVHNSGHFTQDAAATSQFENHWRAILGMPLGKTTTSAGFAMLNLLGPEGVTMRSSAAPILAPPRGMHLHWYEKDEIHPRRKLGHVNAKTDDASRVPAMLEQMEAYRKHWAEALTRPLSEDEEFRRRPEEERLPTVEVERGPEPEGRLDPEDVEIQLTDDEPED